jgi:hypothetical protein
MGQLVNMRGRGAYLDVSTLRALVAFQRFQPEFAPDRVSAWQLRDKPISSLPAVVEIFDFERSLIERPSGSSPVSSASEEMTGASESSPDTSVSPSAAAAGDGAVRSSGEPEPPRATSLESQAARKPQPQRSVDGAVPRPASAPFRQIWVGNSTSFEAEPIMIEPAALVRHVAIVDGVGNGRVGAVLNLVEQALERNVPAIVVDRTGEMSGYARAEWWQHSADQARARRLAERIDVRLFTPGIFSGRPLSVAVVPDLSRLPEAEHDLAVRHAVGAVAAAMPGASGAEPERFALLTRAIGMLGKRSSPSGLVELIALIESGSDELNGTRGDEQLRQGLVADLAALLGNADVFTPNAEALNRATLIGAIPGGPVPLAIINTSFLGDGPRLQSWVSQLIGVLSREIATSTSKTLQAVLALDGADLLLPAGACKAAAREPLLALLKRAGATGLGVVLASSLPAEIDYKRCTDIDMWFVGKTDAQTLEKMKALFKQRPLGHRNPSRLESGRFTMLYEDGARDMERASPLLRIEQIGAPELKSLAARTHPRSRDASGARRVDAGIDDLVTQPHQPR